MYVETAADHAQTAFLASLTPSIVLRDRERTFSKSERKRQRFLRQKAQVEQSVMNARHGAFTREQIEIAQRALRAKESNK